MFSHVNSETLGWRKGKIIINQNGKPSVAHKVSRGGFKYIIEMGRQKKMQKELVKRAQKPKTLFFSLFPESSTVLCAPRLEALKISEYNNQVLHIGGHWKDGGSICGLPSGFAHGACRQVGDREDMGEQHGQQLLTARRICELPATTKQMPVGRDLGPVLNGQIFWNPQIWGLQLNFNFLSS